MVTRQNALQTWLNNLVENSPFELTPITGDASFRRYFRLEQNTTSFIVMDAPPEKEGLSAFVNIARTLKATGVRAPHVFAHDIHLGFALLEDFGNTLLLDNTTPSQTAERYQLALKTLHQIQACTTNTPKLPVFDEHAITRELELFHAWFLTRWLNLTLTKTEEKIIQDAFAYLTKAILTQPQCFMHRDYHSRNLALITPSDTSQIGVLDFQDAMLGPFTYDLASLLKDAYVEWPETTRQAWLQHFYNTLPNTHGWSKDAFQRGFDLCGLQRHLKILGIFCRLHERDGKSRYLNDLPLTLDYILPILQSEKALHPMYDLMQSRVCPRFHENMKLFSETTS